MFRFLLFSVSILGCILVSNPAAAHEYEYSGSIVLGDGLFGAGNWNSGPTTLSWTAYHPAETSCDTHYSYTFEHPKTDTFEFILEIHEAMDLESIWSVNSTLSNVEVGYFSPDSHPGLPEPVYGYRFWGNSGGIIDTISFNSDFPVMWGDFYSGGQDPLDYAWNEGFTSPDDSFPERDESLVDDGSLFGHIVVPGGEGIAFVPEPSFPACLFGLIFLVIRRRKGAGKAS